MNKKKYIREYMRQYRKDKPEIIKAILLRRKKKRALESTLWGRRNPIKLKQIRAREYQNNRARYRAGEVARRAAKLQAHPAWANQGFIDEIYDLAALRTKLTGLAWEVDHIVPLRAKLVSGLHVEQNLRVIPKQINRAKGNRHWPDMPGAF
jgi:5-methylcytosine-specific restriction endonuclease McrA